jgi:rod shape-determining protein MreD
MRLSRLLTIVGVAVVLQLALARYAVGDRFTFDLVLVAVVFVALPGGPVAGMLAGTVGGLAVDALSGGLLGSSALTKTLVGFAAGVLGTRLVVARAHGRAALVAVATLAHAVMRVGLVGVIDQRWPGLPAADMLGELMVNTLFGFAVFVATDGLSGAVARGRHARRSSLERRQW